MWLKNLIKLAVLLAIAAVFWFLHNGSASSSSIGQATFTASSTSKPTHVPTNDIYRGMAMQIHYTADGIDRYLKMIDEIAELGANTIGISTAGYQEHKGSAAITLDIRKCPTPEQFAQLIARARSHNMRVAIMPDRKSVV